MEFFLSQFECCGYEDYKEYLPNVDSTIPTLPLSCCKEQTIVPSSDDSPNQYTCDLENVSKIGCKEAFMDWLKKYCFIIIGVVVGFAVIQVRQNAAFPITSKFGSTKFFYSTIYIQVLGIIFSCVLFNKNQNRELPGGQQVYNVRRY